MAHGSLAALLFHCLFLGKGAYGLVLGVLGPWVELGDLLLAAMCADLDFRKNFDSTLQQRLGHPIVAIPEIHPQMANVSFRFGATMGKADVGLATALDMVLGLDGEEPIVGLIGPAISSVAMPMATTAAVQQIPQISFSATSPLLSNKDAYPYFLRTVPPDTVQAICALELDPRVRCAACNLFIYRRGLRPIAFQGSRSTGPKCFGQSTAGGPGCTLHAARCLSRRGGSKIFGADEEPRLALPSALDRVQHGSTAAACDGRGETSGLRLAGNRLRHPRLAYFARLPAPGLYDGGRPGTRLQVLRLQRSLVKTGVFRPSGKRRSSQAKPARP